MITVDRPPLLLIDTPVLAIESVYETLKSAAQLYRWQIQSGFDPAQSIFAQIVDRQPALVVTITDPLPEWLIPISANAATRRLTMLAMNTGGALEIIERLESVGVIVLQPDQLTAERLESLIALPFDRAALADQCAKPLPAIALKGIHEFNAHEFFECHETLETAWRGEAGSVRNLYRVILQVGLAYYQIQRGNYEGALKMFLRTPQWFAQLPAVCRGVDVAQLQADAHAAQTHLESLSATHIADFDRALMKPVLYKEVS